MAENDLPLRKREMRPQSARARIQYAWQGLMTETLITMFAFKWSFS